MPRKALPMTDDEKKRFRNVRDKMAEGKEVSSEEQVFFATMKERCIAEGVKFEDPSAASAEPSPPAVHGTDPTPGASAGSNGASTAETPRAEHVPSPEAQGGSVEPKKERPRQKGKRPPFEPSIPPDQLAALAISILRAIEVENRKEGFGAIPDWLFVVQQQALTDYLEELAKRGWDLRQLRSIIIMGPAGIVVAQGARRKYAKHKKEKAASERTVVQSVPTQASRVNGSPPREDETTERPNLHAVQLKGDEL